MSQVVRVLYCDQCGNIPLTPGEYNWQMARSNKGWMCPYCHEEASFAHEYFPCLVPGCDGFTDAEMGDNICTSCGTDNFMYYHEHKAGTVPEGELS